jgi:hypothetical protein
MDLSQSHTLSCFISAHTTHSTGLGLLPNVNQRATTHARPLFSFFVSLITYLGKPPPPPHHPISLISLRQACQPGGGKGRGAMDEDDLLNTDIFGAR